MDGITLVLIAFAAISLLAMIPINSILYNLTELDIVANLQIMHTAILVAISTMLTVPGGHIPAKMASRKDAVEALRSG